MKLEGFAVGGDSLGVVVFEGVVEAEVSVGFGVVGVGSEELLPGLFGGLEVAGLFCVEGLLAGLGGCLGVEDGAEEAEEREGAGEAWHGMTCWGKGTGWESGRARGGPLWDGREKAE